MNKILLSTIVGALAGAAMMSTAFAADLIVDSPALAVPTPAVWGGYVEVFGGATLAGSSYYEYASSGSDYDMDAGLTYGAAVGVMTPIQGLAVEIEAMRSGGKYTGYDYGVDNYSLMLNAEYSVPLSDMFSLYAGAGVGVIKTVYDTEDYDDYYSGTGMGYELTAGVSAKITDNLSLFGEVKYQSPFEDIDANDVFINYPTTNVLAGLRLSF
jgi:opacity protein-like surface antigen